MVRLMWSRQFQNCIECGRTDRKHMAKGLCACCYSKQYATNHAETVNAQKHDWYIKQGGAEYSKTQREQRNYDNKRAAVLARDGHKCTSCGATDKLVVHHKDGNGRPKPRGQKNNKLSNLITLCRSCHARLHYVHHPSHH